jgi:tetratricopeptide (TPR) repeat protein
VIARVGVAVVAVIVLALLGLNERAVRLQADGIAATAAQDFDAAERDFRRARRWNPDPTPDLQRAYVYAASSRGPQAVALLEDVLRREPDNRSAWGLLLDFSEDTDPAAARRARAALRRLDPVNARSR